MEAHFTPRCAAPILQLSSAETGRCTEAGHWSRQHDFRDRGRIVAKHLCLLLFCMFKVKTVWYAKMFSVFVVGNLSVLVFCSFPRLQTLTPLSWIKCMKVNLRCAKWKLDVCDATLRKDLRIHGPILRFPIIHLNRIVHYKPSI
jgi:hypothetical protein